MLSGIFSVGLLAMLLLFLPLLPKWVTYVSAGVFALVLAVGVVIGHRVKGSYPVLFRELSNAREHKYNKIFNKRRKD